MSKANHKVREACLICAGSGKNAGETCEYCAGSGVVFAVTGAPEAVLLATGDCKIPVRKAYPSAQTLRRNFT